MLSIGMELARSKNIQFYDICTIYQPTIKDIFDNENINYQKYKMFLLPFMMNSDYCKLDIDNFEMLFQSNITIPETDDKDNQKIFLLPLFLEAMEYFIQEKIDYNEINHSFYFNDNKEKKIDKNNFDEFADIILIMCNEKRFVRPSYEKKKGNARSVLEKLHISRRKKMEKYNENLGIEDIYLTVQYVLKFSNEQMNQLTMWKLMFYFKNIQNEENWRNNFEISLVGGFSDRDKPDMTHWLTKVNRD